MSISSRVRQLIQRSLLWAVDKCSNAQLLSFVTQLASRRVKALPVEDGLRFLFGLEEAMYPLCGDLAIAYGGGVHTKHRHTRYHNFFIQRVHPNERVLDVGCGIGSLAYSVAVHSDASVVGIDLSIANITFARQRYAHPRIKYLVGDILDNLPGDHFDVVILSNVLEHLLDRSKFLKRFGSKAQAPRFLIRVPLFERDWRVPLKKELGVEWRLDPTHETEYTIESFGEEMAEAGLSIIHLEVRWGEIWAEVAGNTA